MAAGNKAYAITPEAKQYIIENCQLTSVALKADIKEQFGVDVTESAVWAHMKRARDAAEEVTRTADSFISQRITENVEGFVDVITNRYQTEIKRIGDILDGTCKEVTIMEDDGEGNKIASPHQYGIYAKLFSQLAKDYMALRPQFPTIDITTNSREREEALLSMFSDDELVALLEKVRIVEGERAIIKQPK